MSIKDLTTADLKRIGRLLKRKETLKAKIDDIDRELVAYESSGAPTRFARHGRPRLVSRRGAAGRPSKRGQLKEQIINALKSTGKQGIAFKDLAAKLGVKYTNISAWFYATGRTIKQIKKVGPAKYAWTGD